MKEDNCILTGSRSTPVCILGAGVTGLAAGLTLTKAGVNTIIVERDADVGGLSRTFKRKGFRFDLGGHRFFTKNDEINQFVNNLMQTEMVTVNRKSSIYYRRKFFNYPIRISNVLLNLGVFSGLQVILSYAWTKIKHFGNESPRESVEDWIVSQFGRKLYEIFFSSYTAKVWGVSGSQLCQEWAGQRIQGFSLPQAIKHAIFRSGEDCPKTLIEKFTYPELGIGRICERMAEEIERHNEIWLNSKVKRINHQNKTITSVDVENSHGMKRIYSDKFISSIPLTLMLRLLNPSPPAKVIEAARRIRFRGLIVIHLIVDRSSVTDQSWVYIQEPSCLISRIHEPKNWSAKMVPNGKTSLVVEVPYSEGDQLSVKTNDEISGLIVKALEGEMHFIKAEEVLDALVIRLPCAYPIYDLGYQEPLGVLMEYVETFSNLQTSGRSGLHKYVNLDHCLECGIQAAENLLGARFDLRLINTKQEYLEVLAS